MTICYIDAFKDQFGVEPICRILNSHLEGGFITAWGYRAEKSRPVSARSIRDQILIEELEAIRAENYGVSGWVSSGIQLGVQAGVLVVTR